MEDNNNGMDNEMNKMEPEKKSNGASVGLVIIVLILIVGGIYIWQNNNLVVAPDAPLLGDEVTPEETTELDELEQDLESLDTDIGVDIDALE